MNSGDAFEAARRDLDAWRGAFPDDPFAADAHLRAVNRRYLTGTRLANLESLGSHFAQTVTGLVAPLVAEYEHHPPELVAFDGAGRNVARVRFDEGHHEAGRLLWDAGIVQFAGVAGASFEQANLLYLASLEGEMGHLCAATCTTGMIRVLRRDATADLRDEYVPRLIDLDYDAALRGAQFLTEVQGGSDVGANAAIAVPAEDGTYRISGEKWFCSVVDADLFLVLARVPGGPEGTGGLGCFLVPRTRHGLINGFAIRRLKEKLGTTSMASGEVDFDDAVAFPVGDAGAGFKIMVTGMLNSSRWLNAIGNLGMMRRAYLEAAAYARHRRAFGTRIGSFPLVRRQLAGMKVEWMAALESTWLLTKLDEAVDVEASGGSPASQADREFHRFLVNANKLVTSMSATDVVRTGIELLGGNGAIESFSVLPRLLRDCIVFEQWEGTHNVLAAQVLRDSSRLDLIDSVVDRVMRIVKDIGDAEVAAVGTRLAALVEPLRSRLVRSVEDPAHGSMHFRSDLEAVVRSLQAALMLEAATTGPDALADECLAAAEHLMRWRLEPGYDPATDPEFGSRIDRVVGADLGGT